MKFRTLSLTKACLATLLLGAAITTAVAAPTSLVFGGYDGSPLNLTERVAIEKGFFGKHGLDVKFVGASSGQQMAAALMGGSAQFGVLTTTAIAPVIRQGQCFTYLASGARAFYNIIAQPDLDRPNAAKPFPENLVDLKGKRIAINARGTALEFMMNAVLKQAGIDPSEVTYIATGGAATAVAAFRNKQVDAAIDFPIQEQLLKSDEFVSVARLMDIEKDNPIYNLTQVYSGTTCEYAQKNPQVVESFCAAVGEAYQYLNDPKNSGEMLDLVQKTLGLDRGTTEAFWQQYKGVWPTPKIDTASWEAQKILLPAGTDLPDYNKYVSSACQGKL